MDDESDLSFNVIYRDQECRLQLFKYDTVGDLKTEIHKELGIAPYKQIIECWHIPPESDANTLITCCLALERNYLIVYNVEDNLATSPPPPQTIKASPLGSNNSTNQPRENETSAVLSFLQYFSTNFGYRGITLQISCLEDAIRQVSSGSPETRQVLVLYLHNKNDSFSQIFCEQLTKPDIQSILNNRFFLLCWDIEKDEYKSVLIEALQLHNELQKFDRYITRKTCAALLIVPMEGTVKILSIMKGKISPNDFMFTLKQAEECLVNGNQEDQNYAFGSKEYQQLMLNMLGDRDYDSFDFYEFNFLKDKIAYALYGPPQDEEGYKDEKQKNKINFLFNTILEQNNRIAKWKDRVIISFIYVCTEPLPKEKEKRAQKFPDYNPKCDLTPFPIFVLRKCKHSQNPCRVFIDDSGRVYKTWKDYLTSNKLPECEMILPKNGRYVSDENGDVLLERVKSPACDISTSILQGADIASAVGGIASGGVMVAAAAIPAIAAAPLVLPIAGITGAAVGVYSVGRSAFAIYDRSKHEESLSFFESSEARGAYINIVGGALGFVGAGANMAVSKLAAQGFNISKGATAAVNTINIVNLGAGGVGVVNASYDVLRNWLVDNETPSLLTIVQLSSSILFFGHAVYNYKSISTIIEESQANTLRDYQDSLRSNRHRKAFTKLLKETIRQRDGSIQQGQADVISTIKNIQNKDEVFATLTRANKAMNENSVRFAAKNGEITLNGVSVDMAKFSSMEKNEVITFLTKLPNTPKPGVTDVKVMSTYIQNSFQGIGVGEIAPLALGLLKMFGSTDLTIKEKIINAVSQLIDVLLVDPAGYMDILDKIFPDHNKYFRLVSMVNTFFQMLVNEAEEKFRRWRETGDPEDEEPYFIRLVNLDAVRRAVEIFNVVTRVYYEGTHLTKTGLLTLLDYFYTWFTNQVYSNEERQERRNQRTEHSRTPAPKVSCSECRGFCYSPRNL